MRIGGINVPGFVIGALALITLQVVVQPTASTRVGGLFGWLGDAARRLVDPTLPAISDHRGAKAPAPAPAATPALAGAVYPASNRPVSPSPFRIGG